MAMMQLPADPEAYFSSPGLNPSGGVRPRTGGFAGPTGRSAFRVRPPQPGEPEFVGPVRPPQPGEPKFVGERVSLPPELRGPVCFAAGTPLLTPTGAKLVEEFRRGDLILSRPESAVDADVEVKAVEEVFVRVAPVLNLHVGGRVIRTTGEHPFYALGRGWVFARELAAGDKLSTHEGRWVAVESVTDSGEVTTVYNLRVSEFHTYFVGSPEWGFSVWAHNLCYQEWLTKHGLEHSPELEAMFKSAVNRTLTPESEQQLWNLLAKQRQGVMTRRQAWNDLQVVELENLPKGRALTAKDSKVLRDWLEGADGYGGRWGSKEVRELNHAWASKYENEGWTVTHGAGRPSVANPKGSEEFFRGPAAGDKTYVDITLKKGNETMRIQTVDTKGGVTLTDKEAAAVARIRGQFPQDKLVVVSKETGKVIATYP